MNILAILSLAPNIELSELGVDVVGKGGWSGDIAEAP